MRGVHGGAGGGAVVVCYLAPSACYHHHHLQLQQQQHHGRYPHQHERERGHARVQQCAHGAAHHAHRARPPPRTSFALLLPLMMTSHYLRALPPCPPAAPPMSRSPPPCPAATPPTTPRSTPSPKIAPAALALAPPLPPLLPPPTPLYPALPKPRSSPFSSFPRTLPLLLPLPLPVHARAVPVRNPFRTSLHTSPRTVVPEAALPGDTGLHVHHRPQLPRRHRYAAHPGRQRNGYVKHRGGGGSGLSSAHLSSSSVSASASAAACSCPCPAAPLGDSAPWDEGPGRAERSVAKGQHEESMARGGLRDLLAVLSLSSLSISNGPHCLSLSIQLSRYLHLECMPHPPLPLLIRPPRFHHPAPRSPRVSQPATTCTRMRRTRPDRSFFASSTATASPAASPAPSLIPPLAPTRPLLLLEADAPPGLTTSTNQCDS
ncbi:unnamed protein product [Closterium sp. NIES-54]